MCLSKKLFSFLKIAKGSKFARECDWIVKVLKTFEIWGFFQKKEGFFQNKILTVLKMAKGSKFAVECDWKSKNSRNVQS